MRVRGAAGGAETWEHPLGHEQRDTGSKRERIGSAHLAPADCLAQVALALFIVGTSWVISPVTHPVCRAAWVNDP